MSTIRVLRMAAGYTWRLGLCAFAYVAGSAPRRHLILALGLAFYVLVGLYGMIQTYWLAPTLLVLHNFEIFTDSMVYALAIALLLVRGGDTRVGRAPAHDYSGERGRSPYLMKPAALEE